MFAFLFVSLFSSQADFIRLCSPASILGGPLAQCNSYPALEKSDLNCTSINRPKRLRHWHRFSVFSPHRCCLASFSLGPPPSPPSFHFLSLSLSLLLISSLCVAGPRRDMQIRFLTSQFSVLPRGPARGLDTMSPIVLWPGRVPEDLRRL